MQYMAENFRVVVVLGVGKVFFVRAFLAWLLRETVSES
jgi:hypothetical protein